MINKRANNSKCNTLLLLITGLCWGQDFDEGEVELWDDCYSIENTTELELTGLYIDGEIPSEIGNLINLVSLNLAANRFSGSIPPEIGNLEGLTNLKLSSNQLTGSIPPEIGNLEGLTNLGLQGNQLTGSIPPEIGNTVNIGTNYGSINQSNHKLTGYVPESICNLTTDNK